MGWADAPVVAGGENWKKAPQVEGGENVVMQVNGGRIVQSQSGKLSFVSPSYATSDPAIVKKIMDGASAGELSKASIREGIIAEYPLAARLTKFVEGTPFVGSYVDELIGSVAGQDATVGVRALSSAMQEQRPGQSMALGLGGGLLGGMGMAAAAPAKLAAALAPGTGRLMTQIGRGLLTGSGLGAVEGVVYGSGTGTDAATRGQGAGMGAAIGGATGGLLGAFMPLAQAGVKNIAGAFNRSDVDKIAADLKISKEAATVIRNVFDQGGDFAAASAALRKAGDEGMLADAGYAAQALLDASAQTGGQAGNIARSAIEDRMTRTGVALDKSLDTALGPAPIGPRTAVDAIAKKSAPARSLAYQTAYDAPINYASHNGRKIEEVINRISPDDMIAGITEANKEMLARGEVNQQIMAVIGDNGQVKFLREMPNVRQLDEIKKALQRIAYSPANTDAFGRLTGTGQRYNDLAGQLRDATAAAVPKYGAAVSIGGDKLAEERAFVLGRDLLSPKTEIEDIGLGLGKKPSADQLASAKQGLRSYIDKIMGDVKSVASDPNIDARQVVKAVTDMSSDNARAKIKALMGKEADKLLAQIDMAAQSAAVRAAMATNSKTAVRQYTQGAVKEMTEPGIIGKALAGEPLNASKELMQAVTGQTKELSVSQQQKIFGDIARALTQKKGASAQAALAYIEQALAGQPLTAAQNAFIAQQVSALGLATGTPAIQEMIGAR